MDIIRYSHIEKNNKQKMNINVLNKKSFSFYKQKYAKFE